MIRTIPQVERRLRNAWERYLEEVRQIADEVRESMLVPYVKKHEPEGFIAGNGTWYMSSVAKHRHVPEEFAKRPAAVRVLELGIPRPRRPLRTRLPHGRRVARHSHPVKAAWPSLTISTSASSGGVQTILKEGLNVDAS